MKSAQVPINGAMGEEKVLNIQMQSKTCCLKMSQCIQCVQQWYLIHLYGKVLDITLFSGQCMQLDITGLY